MIKRRSFLKGMLATPAVLGYIDLPQAKASDRLVSTTGITEESQMKIINGCTTATPLEDAPRKRLN